MTIEIIKTFFFQMIMEKVQQSTGARNEIRIEHTFESNKCKFSVATL